MPKQAHFYPQPELFSGVEAVRPNFAAFPKTRYQGSKRRLLPELYDIFSRYDATSAIDLYSGTATVSLLLRLMGWHVTANDFLSFNNTTARVLLGPRPTGADTSRIRADLTYLLEKAPLNMAPLVANSFQGIYFTDDENLEIDRFCQNLHEISHTLRDLYIYAVGQALLMKRPYNLFHRANLNMRTRSVTRSFGNVKTWNTSIVVHASKIAANVLAMPVMGSPPESFVTNQNTMDLTSLPDLADLIYLDPPYLNSSGIGVDYCSFYHFLDGLCDYDRFSQFDPRYPHRPILANPSAWQTEQGGLSELARILRKWPRSTVVLSYRNDGRPSFDDIAAVFKAEGRSFKSTAHSFKYALSHKDDTKELFLISHG